MDSVIRYPEGSYVYVRNDLEVGKIYDDVGVVTSMAKDFGKRVKIVSVIPIYLQEKEKTLYIYRIEGSDWNWTAEMFIPMHKKHDVKPFETKEYMNRADDFFSVLVDMEE